MTGDAVAKVGLTDEEGNGQHVGLDIGGSVVAFAGEGEGSLGRLVSVILIPIALEMLHTGSQLFSSVLSLQILGQVLR